MMFPQLQRSSFLNGSRLRSFMTVTLLLCSLVLFHSTGSSAVAVESGPGDSITITNIPEDPSVEVEDEITSGDVETDDPADDQQFKQAEQFTRSKASKDVQTSKVQSNSMSWLSLSWLRTGDPYDYPVAVDGDLQQIHGFKYCGNLNGAVFDTVAPLRAKVVSVFLDELNNVQSSRYDTNSLLYQYVLSRRMARMFSPTLDLDILERASSSDVDWITIEQIGTKRFAEMIDFIAEFLHKTVTSKFLLRPIQHDRFSDTFISRPIDDDRTAKRFACFIASDGSNDWVRLTLGRRKLMRFVDGKTYFDKMIDYDPMNITLATQEANALHDQVANDLLQASHSPNNQADADAEVVKPSKKEQEEIDQLRTYLSSLSANINSPRSQDSFSRPIAKYSVRPHKLAYVLLVHGKYESVVNLIEALSDPYVTILIHVDAKYPWLKAKLAKYIASQARRKNGYNRIRIMNQSFDCLWGYSSLIHAQLAGFFELQNMNTGWEYAINLSGSDYPLRTNDVIYDDLKNHKGKNFIDFWVSLEAVSRVYDSPLLASKESYAGQPSGMSPVESSIDIDGVDYSSEKIKAIKEALQTSNYGYMSFPFSHWRVYKHSQWMILDREFVKNLKSSPIAMYMAAYMEWTMIPDESYFATMGLNSPSYRIQIVNDNKRYLQFPIGAPHPRQITPEDLPVLLDNVLTGVAFTRKVNMEKANSWFLVYGIEKIRSWDHYHRDHTNRNTTTSSIPELPKEGSTSLLPH